MAPPRHTQIPPFLQAATNRTCQQSSFEKKTRTHGLSRNPLNDFTQRLLFNTHTLWLFTQSNLKDTYFPSMTFALTTAFFSDVFGYTSTATPIPTETILSRLPLSLAHLYFALLIFCLHNQHRTSSVTEDAVNKPWRPLPAKRITVRQTNVLLALAYPAWYLIAWHIGGLRPTAVLNVLTVYYNELGGSDLGGFARNILNASGYSCFFAGALQALLGPDADVYCGSANMKGLEWFAVMVGLIFSTIHIQDFRDREGDSLRDRQTVQTAVGDATARAIVVVMSVFWSVFIPTRLGFGWGTVGVCMAFAAVMNVLLLRSLGKRRTVAREILAYKAWCAWFVSVMLCPWVQWGMDQL